MYIGSAEMPVFFVNGTNDFAYPLDSYSKTYGLVKGKRNLRITVNMPHGHQQGWAPKEIGLFIDQYLKSSIPLPTIVKTQLTNEKLRARIKSKIDCVSAKLHYTTGTGPINKLEWQSISAHIQDGFIDSSSPPDGARIWFLTVTDKRGATVSSETMFASNKK
jgi:hypothetical protein